MKASFCTILLIFWLFVFTLTWTFIQYVLFALSFVSETSSLPSKSCINLNYAFPEDFLFGASSSAYQIEGGWNASGRGPSIWDTSLHTFPETVKDRTNGDVACDSYHKYADDVEALREVGVRVFSLNFIKSKFF